MFRHEPRSAGPIGPRDLIENFPGEPCAASGELRWVGLEAVRYRNQPPNELLQPPLTHHTLLLLLHTPREFEMQCAGVNRVGPPPAGSVLVVPAGCPARFWGSSCESLHVFLEPAVVARAAAGAFGSEGARVAVSPRDGLRVPQLKAAMLAVNEEMSAHAAGSRLAAESLANVLAVHLLRAAAAPGTQPRGPGGALARRKLRAVVEYVEQNLDAALTVERLAAAAHLSAYHFARQFKVATAVPPHRYVLARRVERALLLLESDRDLPLAEVAASVGFSDQSQFSHHFKRLFGVPPGRFRMSARFA